MRQRQGVEPASSLQESERALPLTRPPEMVVCLSDTYNHHIKKPSRTKYGWAEI